MFMRILRAAGAVQHVVVDDNLDLDLGHEIDLILGSAIDFLVAALAPEALDLGHGHALDADARQGLLDLVQLVGPGDYFYSFHDSSQMVGWLGLIGRFTVHGHIQTGLFLFVVHAQRYDDADDLEQNIGDDE